MIAMPPAAAPPPRRPPAGPGTVDYWAAALDPDGELPVDLRTLLASRVRGRWMAVVGRLGAAARTPQK
ncbi:hypothetical protein [Frankia tisae]|uniref:hypothetical protein n=1 Tax=Frankia tisae TaxID=2950104 RepID=UPI0021C0686A|nr:hypothetical protein [Frankia tisae]